LDRVPEDSRAVKADHFFQKDSVLTKENLERVQALNEIAKRRGQSLAQLALSWCLRDSRVTTVLIGASRPEQIKENVGALDKLEFSKDELDEIDQYAKEGGVNMWAESSNAG
jgi:L-glyceraldehyde 3-phosphate reductase